MPTRERPVDRGTRMARARLHALGNELRNTRRSHGLSQRAVGVAAGISHTEVGRIERGEAPRVPFIVLGRVAAVLGHELATRLFPSGEAIRDAAQLALLDRLRAELHPSWIMRTEVPFPSPGDRRAWDATLLGPGRIGVEAESHVDDQQATERRLALKARDGGMDHLLLLLADTRYHRDLLRRRPLSVGSGQLLPPRVVLAALRAGRDPGGDAVVLL